MTRNATQCAARVHAFPLRGQRASRRDHRPFGRALLALTLLACQPVTAAAFAQVALTPGLPSAPSRLLDTAAGPIAWRPDGRVLAALMHDFHVVLWDAASGQRAGEPLCREFPCRAFVWSPDGRQMLTWAADSVVRVLDVATRTASGPAIRCGDQVNHAAWSPDGRRILIAAGRSAQMFDPTNGARIGAPMPQNATVAGAEWSPDGTRIATRSSDSTASIWDARSSRRLVGPLHHDGSVSYVAWSPDGSRLALAGTTAATLWNASTGARVAILSDPTGAELPAWSPDGRQLATPVYDGTVRISDGASGAPIGAPLRHGYRWVISVAWSHDGRRLATGSYFGHFARIWDGATRRPLLELRTDDKVGQVAWSADDRWLATVDRYSGRLVLWDLAAPSAGTR